MREEAEEERLWDIYLRGDMKQSFNDWRAELTRKASAKNGMTGAELVAARKTAIDIMKRCKPPEE